MHSFSSHALSISKRFTYSREYPWFHIMLPFYIPLVRFPIFLCFAPTLGNASQSVQSRTCYRFLLTFKSLIISLFDAPLGTTTRNLTRVTPSMWTADNTVTQPLHTPVLNLPFEQYSNSNYMFHSSESLSIFPWMNCMWPCTQKLGLSTNYKVPDQTALIYFISSQNLDQVQLHLKKLSRQILMPPILSSGHPELNTTAFCLKTMFPNNPTSTKCPRPIWSPSTLANLAHSVPEGPDLQRGYHLSSQAWVRCIINFYYRLSPFSSPHLW